MDVLGKLRTSDERPGRSAESSRQGAVSVRRSNGLKDFLWLMPEVEQGRLLDLGPVAQSTVMFFTDRGFRVTTDDLVRSWDDFEADWKREHAASDPAAEPPDPAEIAAAFLESNLRFETESFHGILVWDACDYLESELLAPLVARLHELLAPSGVLLAGFHDSTEVEPMNYRVRDTETVDLVPSRRSRPIQRVFQNREILALFAGFRSSRTYVGRDHLREALFLK